VLHLDETTRLGVTGILYTVTDIDGGRTAEQERFLDALARHVMRVPSGDAPVMTAAEAAQVVADKPRLCKSIGELLVTLELMRHPASAALTQRVEEYLAALGIDDGFQQLAADYLVNDRKHIERDWERIRQPNIEESFIAGLSDDDVGARMQALGDLPAGSLGRALFDFYRRNGFPFVPDDDPEQGSLVPHDLTHVLAGYGTTAEAEIALQAFMVGAARGERHFSSLAASLLLFEVGMMPFPGIEATEGVLGRPGAAELVATAIERGLQCAGDIEGDHAHLLPLPLIEVRSKLGIPEPDPGPHMFIL
jgi:hypothetical protein